MRVARVDTREIAAWDARAPNGGPTMITSAADPVLFQSVRNLVAAIPDLAASGDEVTVAGTALRGEAGVTLTDSWNIVATPGGRPGAIGLADPKQAITLAFGGAPDAERAVAQLLDGARMANVDVTGRIIQAMGNIGSEPPTRLAVSSARSAPWA